VLAVLLAGLREAGVRLEVVVAVGQAQAGGVDVCDHAGGLVVVRAGVEPERHGHGEVVEATDRALHAGQVRERVELGQERLERLRAERVRAPLVHAGAVVVRDELLDAAFGPRRLRGHLVEDHLELVLRRLPGRPAAAPPDHGRRDRVLPAPAAVAEREEVRAGAHGAVEVVRVDAADGRLLGREDDGVGGEDDGGEQRDQSHGCRFSPVQR
jgi:hypothetical protein